MPADLSSWFETALNLRASRSEYEQRYERALSYILSKCRKGRWKLYGRELHTAGLEEIEAEMFSKDLILAENRRDLVGRGLDRSQIYDVQIAEGDIRFALEDAVVSVSTSSNIGDEQIRDTVIADRQRYQSTPAKAHGDILLERFPLLKDPAGRLKEIYKQYPELKFRRRGRPRKK